MLDIRSSTFNIQYFFIIGCIQILYFRMLITDFKPNLLPLLYNSLKEQGYVFITFNEYLQNKNRKKFVILRHDVEKHYQNALKFAEIQHEMGISGSYFFRMSDHYDEDVIRKDCRIRTRNRIPL